MCMLPLHTRVDLAARPARRQKIPNLSVLARVAQMTYLRLNFQQQRVLLHRQATVPARVVGNLLPKVRVPPRLTMAADQRLIVVLVPRQVRRQIPMERPIMSLRPMV